MPTKGKLKKLTEKLSYRHYLILLGVGCVALFFLLFSTLSRMDDKVEEQQAVRPINTVQVVVAAQDIPQRAVVKKAMLKMVEVPEELVPAGALTDMESVLDHPASVMIQQGDVLTDKKVYVDIRMAGFPGMIPADCRAISVPITDVTGVAGFAKPGDYVDVMLINNQNSSRVEGEILLQNVLLLGVNKKAENADAQATASNNNEKDKKDDSKKEGQKKGGNVQASEEAMATATFALAPEEALKLAVASSQGTIYLVLRPVKPRDMFVLDTSYYQLKSNAPAAPTPSATPAPAAASSVPSVVPAAGANTIEVIRGTSVTTVGVDD